MDGYGYGLDQRAKEAGDSEREVLGLAIATRSMRLGHTHPMWHRFRLGGVRAVRQGPGGLTDPEMKRKKRIAKYKVYTVEGKVKASLRRGICWIKNKCSKIIHGY
ncbi:DUF3511 domain protein [Salix suchowensis]|nr:DUF3511 domain protein [Salix suchowensis]